MNFPDNVTRLCNSKRFTFACHPAVPCFTECCRELELALTPYDVLRLRRELGIGAADFIERFVVVEQDEKENFPRLYLAMVDDGRASCPFVGENGCQVYNSRPGACRSYPVGRGITLDENGVKQALHVLVREEHCQGFAEEQRHTVAEWFENQGLLEYNEINDELLGLLQHEQVRKGIGFTGEQKDYFMLALYKLDEFREFIAAPNNADMFRMSDEERNSLSADDFKLLRFGVDWLKEILFAEKND